MSTLNDRVARVLAASRVKAKLTQSAAASLTGWDQTKISRVENGDTNITVDMLDTLAPAYGTTAAKVVKAAS